MPRARSVSRTQCVPSAGATRVLLCRFSTSARFRVHGRFAQSIARRLTAIELDRCRAERRATPFARSAIQTANKRRTISRPTGRPMSASRDPIHDRQWLAALLDACHAAHPAPSASSRSCAGCFGARTKSDRLHGCRDTLRHVQHTLEGVVPLVDPARRDDARRAFGGAGRVRSAQPIGPARDRRGRRRTQPTARLPADRQSRAALESDAVGTTDRTGRSHRADAHGPRDPPRGGWHGRDADSGATAGASRASTRRHMARRIVGDVREVRPEADHIVRLIVAGEGGEEPVASPDTELATPVVTSRDSRFSSGGDMTKPRASNRHAPSSSRIRRDPELPLVSSWIHAPLVVRSSRAGFQAILATKSLLVWRLSWDDGAGRAMESHLMAVVVEGVPRPATPSAARHRVQELAEHLAPHDRRSQRRVAGGVGGRRSERSWTHDWHANVPSCSRSATRRPRVSTGAVRSPRRSTPASSCQEAADLTRQLSARLAFVERMSAAHARPPSLLLAVLP